MFTEQTEAELPKNEPMIVFDYFVACMFQLAPPSVLLTQNAQPQQQQVTTWSTILRLLNTPITYEGWEQLHHVLVHQYQQKFPEQKVERCLIQNVNLLGQFEIPNATMFSHDELKDRTFITPDNKIVFKDENNDKTIS